MTSLPLLRLFEQPATTNQAVLSCGHTVALWSVVEKRKDGWYSEIHCDTCIRRREVVSVIYVKANT